MTTRRRFLSAAAAVPAAARPRGGANAVPLRTHEWFGDRLETFDFPAGWRLSVQHMKGHLAPPLSPAEIRRAVQNPVAAKPLREIAAGKSTVAIAFDDLTRPTPTYDVVPPVVAELRAAGIRDENILFIAAYGCHYQMNGMEVAKKLGDETVRRHPWLNHNIWESLVELGKTRVGNRVFLNPYFYKADVKITLRDRKSVV